MSVVKGGVVAGSFEEWMSLLGPELKRAAVLLCSRMDNPAGYAQRTLTNVYLSRWRRLRRDRSKSHLFAAGDAPDEFDAVADRAALATWLESLGTKQRAAVVWRYYCDLSIPESAPSVRGEHRDVH